MNRLALASLSAGLAVAAGAFGAHALRDQLEPARLAAFETAARYQMMHALAVLALEAQVRERPVLARASALMLGGTLLFSGSLYALSLSGVRVFGAITPLGGLAWIAAWVLAAAAFLRPATGTARPR